MNRTVSTYDSVEMVDLKATEVSPLMAQCVLKVFYTGQNRNGSCITKPVAEEMAKSLRGCPIVGYYKDDKEDFRDHGEVVTLDSEGIHFKNKTRPYGFVAPDAKVWFQKFVEQDEFGNPIEREYLVTEAFLWKQYSETNTVLDNPDGRPHSMELDEQTLEGHWSEDYNKNMEFFIIDDAIFSKLCILGEDVEPCFEGSSITPKNYNLDDTFKNSLFSMLEDIKKFYTLNKGGEIVENTQEVVEDAVVDTETVESTENVTNTEFSEETLDNSEEIITEENVELVESDFVKKDDDKDDADDKDDVDDKEDATDDTNDADDAADDDEDKKKKYSLLEEELESFKEKYAALEKEVEDLRAFKLEIESKEKDTLIEQFYMLSDEDKADVIANKANYSLSEIKSKLSVICFDKKISFESEEPKEEEPSITFDLNNIESEESDLPEWVISVQEKQKEMMN